MEAGPSFSQAPTLSLLSGEYTLQPANGTELEKSPPPISDIWWAAVLSASKEAGCSLDIKILTSDPLCPFHVLSVRSLCTLSVSISAGSQAQGKGSVSKALVFCAQAPEFHP